MNFARIWCITNPIPARRVTPPWKPGPVDRERPGGSPNLSCKRDQIKMRHYMDRRVTPPKRVTSPPCGPPPPCKQALTISSLQVDTNNNKLTELIPCNCVLLAIFKWMKNETFDRKIIINMAFELFSVGSEGTCAWRVLCMGPTRAKR